MEPGRRFYWVPGLSREKVPGGIWSALACDDEVGGLTNPVLRNHEGGRRPGLCVGLRTLAPGFSMYLCTCLREGEGGERRGGDEPDKNLLGFGNEENMWSRLSHESM